MPAETITLASLSRLATPLLNEILKQAKKYGAKGFNRWEAATFPRKIANRIKNIDTVRTIWKSQPLSLQTFFHPPKLILNDKPEFIIKLSDLNDNAIIIEGIVGQGKSILLRSLAINEITSNSAKRLPLFLELKDLSEKNDLQSTIYSALESYDINADEDSVEYFFKSGKFALLLDGFDEIEEKLVKHVYIQIDYLAKKYPELLIIVTSRPGQEIQKSPNFKTLKIAELTPPEFPAFLSKLGVNTEKSLNLRQAIKNSPSKLNNLIKTPLMLTLVVIVYEAEISIPETLPEFFDKLFHVVVTNHDRLKGGFTRVHQTGLSERGLQTVFEAFCFMTLQLGHNRTLSSDQFYEIFNYAIDFTNGLECKAEDFKADITNTACLMLEEGLGNVTYLHKSILDYYAASFVRKLNENNSKKFYEAMLQKTSGWEDVIGFLKSIDTFRYSEKFIIPFTEFEKEKLCKNLDNASDLDIFNRLFSAYNDFGLCYRINPENNQYAVISAFTTQSIRAGDHLTALPLLLFQALNSTMPDPLSCIEIEEKFKFSPLIQSPNGEEFYISGKAIINAYGATKIRSSLGIYESKLTKMHENAQEIIKSEEKKELIFSIRSN